MCVIYYLHLFQWDASTSGEYPESEPVVGGAEHAPAAAPGPSATELQRAEVKPEPKAKSEAKPETKSLTKPDKSKTEAKTEEKVKKEKVEKSKAEYKTDSGGEGSASTPPTRRRASADQTNGTPDRKKRRLTRPRKL